MRVPSEARENFKTKTTKTVFAFMTLLYVGMSSMSVLYCAAKVVLCPILSSDSSCSSIISINYYVGSSSSSSSSSVPLSY